MNSELEKWRAHGITDYSFQFNWSCFCPEEYTRPVIITVRNNTIEKIVVHETGEALTEKQLENYVTIEGLFNLINQARESGAAVVSARYHDDYHYPTQAFIDYNADIMDEEMSFVVSDLHALGK